MREVEGIRPEAGRARAVGVAHFFDYKNLTPRWAKSANLYWRAKYKFKYLEQKFCVIQSCSNSRI